MGVDGIVGVHRDRSGEVSETQYFEVYEIAYPGKRIVVSVCM